jgi:hypothetical protein
MIDHEYVALKLVNGDNIIGLMVDEDDDRFIVMYPIQMKSISVTIEGRSKEILAGSPWCSFTDHEVFQIWKNDVIMIKPLNDSTIHYYKRLIDVTEASIDLYEESDSEELMIIKGNQTIH